MAHLVPTPSANRWAQEFDRQRCVVVPNAIPADLVLRFRQQSLALLHEYSHSIQQDVATRRLDYRVVTGEVIRDRFPELYEFYASPESREWIREITGAEQIHVSDHLRSSVNINLLENPGQ